MICLIRSIRLPFWSVLKFELHHNEFFCDVVPSDSLIQNFDLDIAERHGIAVVLQENVAFG